MNEQEIIEALEKRIIESINKQVNDFWLYTDSYPKELTGFNFKQ